MTVDSKLEVSRRNFLKSSGYALGATLLPNVNALASYSKEIPEYIEGLPVYGLKKPFTPEQLKAFGESREAKDEDIYKRPIQFLVGDNQWKAEYVNDAGESETTATFLSRHTKRFNQILAKCNPDIGVSTLTIHPSIVIVDEDWLKTQSMIDRQFTGEDGGSYMGRWSFDGTYIPRESAYWHQGYDDGLFHEWAHYFLYLSPHLFNYLDPSQENWSHLLDRVAEIDPQAVARAYKGKKMAEEFKSNMLSYATLHFLEKRSLFARAEELYIRNCAVETKTRNFDGNLGRDMNVLGNLPGVKIAGLDRYIRSTIYIGGVDRYDWSDNVDWFFDPQAAHITNARFTSLEFTQGHLSGGAVDKNGNEQPGVAKAVIVMGENEDGNKDALVFNSWHIAYIAWENTLAGKASKTTTINVDDFFE